MKIDQTVDGMVRKFPEKVGMKSVIRIVPERIHSHTHSKKMLLIAL